MDFDRFDGGAAAVNDHVDDNSDHDDVVDAAAISDNDQEEEGDSGYNWVDGMILMIMTMLLMLMVVNRRRRVTVGTTGWTAPLLIISTGPRENQTQLMVMTTSKDAFGPNISSCLQSDHHSQLQLQLLLPGMENCADMDYYQNWAWNDLNCETAQANVTSLAFSLSTTRVQV